jgi:hypothetical protein
LNPVAKIANQLNGKRRRGESRLLALAKAFSRSLPQVITTKCLCFGTVELAKHHIIVVLKILLHLL